MSAGPVAGVVTEHDQILKGKDQVSGQPYAMNFTDEAAQNLGLHNGRWDVIDAGHDRGGLLPTLSGGLEKGNPMIELQWRLDR